MCFSLCFWRIVIFLKKCGVVLFLERKTWLGFYKLSSCRWRLLFCLPNLFNKQWSQDIKYWNFFLGLLLFSLHFRYFQPKGYVWERKTNMKYFPLFWWCFRWDLYVLLWRKTWLWCEAVIVYSHWTERTGLVEW